MKYLGLDIGHKVVGMAESESRIVASPLPAIKMDRDFLRNLGQVINSEEIKVVVFGLPCHQDGSENGLAGEIRELAKVVQAEFKVEVDFIDEYGTTKEAEAILKNAGIDNRDLCKYDDSMAAVLILERYFKEGKK
jgi:putative holliday junction resolvase